jgi:hypothetical protein
MAMLNVISLRATPEVLERWIAQREGGATPAG